MLDKVMGAKRRSSPGKRAQADNGAEAKPERDLVLIHGFTEDGKGLQVLRCRGETIEAGAVHPLREGAPIHGEVVRLRPRPEAPLVCDVDVELPAKAQPKEAESRGRPAQVATDRYRKNWDAIWRRPGKRQLSN